MAAVAGYVRYGRRPILLVAGASLVGKTRLANKLGELTGFEVIHCDKFRERFWFIADEQKRSSERYRHYEEAILQRRNGLIIEGDDLIGRNRGDTELVEQGSITQDTTLSLSLLMHLKSQPDARAYIVGFIEPDVDAVVAAIWHHTKRRRLMALSDEHLRKFVLARARQSKQLKSMADGARIPFIELTGYDPDSAIDAAARLILREVDWPVLAS
jgi:hypothetical protein